MIKFNIGEKELEVGYDGFNIEGNSFHILLKVKDSKSLNDESVKNLVEKIKSSMTGGLIVLSSIEGMSDLNDFISLRMNKLYDSKSISIKDYNSKHEHDLSEVLVLLDSVMYSKEELLVINKLLKVGRALGIYMVILEDGKTYHLNSIRSYVKVLEI